MSGKTEYISDLILKEADRRPDEGFLFVVPEQATLINQQALIARQKRGVLFNIDVLSITRLAHRLFEEQGIVLPQVIDELGKTMLIRKALYECEKELTVFRTSIRRRGFADKIKKTLTELDRYNVSEAALMSAYDMTPSVKQLKGKLHDIMVIRRTFFKLLGDRFITGEMLLYEMIKAIPNSRMLKNSTVVIDGFGTLTALQQNVMRMLFATCRDVYCVLTITSKGLKDSSPSALFAPSKETYDSYVSMAAEDGVEIGETYYSDETADNYGNRALYLLRNSFEGLKKDSIKNCANIYATAAHSPEDEVVLLTGKVLELVREKNYRYSDIAVYTSGAQEYKDLIERYFRAAGIRCFIDNRRSIENTIPVRAVNAALSAVSSSFSADSVMAYLRSGITDETKTIDMIDNYVLARGIRSKKGFTQDWMKTTDLIDEKTLSEINSCKNELIKPLLTLSEALKDAKGSSSDKASAIKAFLTEICIDEICAKKASYLNDQGYEELAQEYSQAMVGVDYVLEQFISVLDGEKISNDELADMLTTGFQSVKVGIVPPVLDAVIVADPVRSRMSSKKAVFVVGMDEASFPGDKQEDDILGDADRDALGALQVSLAHTSKTENYNSQYFMYRMFTCATHELYMSYSAAGSDSKLQHACYYLKKITEAFSGLPSCSDTDRIYDRKQGLIKLARGEIKDKKEEAALKAFFEDDEYSVYLDKIDLGVKYGARYKALDKNVARELFVPEGVISASRLESFASCRMAYFLGYGLELEKRKIWQLMQMDIGTLCHKILEKITDEIMLTGSDYSALAEGQTREYIERAIKNCEKRGELEIFSDLARNRFLKEQILSMLDINLRIIAAQINAGDFLPDRAEHCFDRSTKNAIRVDGFDDIWVKGKVDRVDVSNSGIRIIDYKTGTAGYSFKDLYNGLKLQLFLYLAAEMEDADYKGDKKPAGAFYYKVQDPEPELTADKASARGDVLDKLLLAEKMKLLRLDGVVSDEFIAQSDRELTASNSSTVLQGVSLTAGGAVNATSLKKNVAKQEDIEELCALARDKVREFVGGMLSGEIDPNPYRDGKRNSCGYCPYRTVCGFDTTVKDMNYRTLDGKSQVTYLSEQELKRKEGTDAGDSETAGDNRS